VNKEIRDNLLMMLDEAVQVVYEKTDKTYTDLDADLKRVIDALFHAQDTVRREL